MMTLEQIVIDMPIYASFTTTLFSKDIGNVPAELSDSSKKQLHQLFHTKKITIKCVDCKKYYSFDVSHSINKFNSKLKNYAFLNVLNNEIACEIDSSNLLNGDIVVPDDDEGIISYLFKCNMNSSHYQTMDLFYQLKNNVLYIRKIGQKPLNIDLQERHSNEYKTILDSYDSFNDYRNYEQCESRNLLAGACTYLRRIFEKMIYAKLKNSGKTEEEIKALNHIEDKIKEVRDQFDDDIQEVLNQSYGLLSKGIHELSNDEIDTFYKLILEVINIQLESEKESRERDEKRKKLRSEINKASL